MFVPEQVSQVLSQGKQYSLIGLNSIKVTGVFLQGQVPSINELSYL